MPRSWTINLFFKFRPVLRSVLSNQQDFFFNSDKSNFFSFFMSYELVKILYKVSVFSLHSSSLHLP